MPRRGGQGVPAAARRRGQGRARCVVEATVVATQAQTVARDILRKAREMDRVVAGTKYSAKLGGREAVIWRELRTGGGSPVIIVTTSSTRAEFGDATTALDCFVTHAQEAVVRKNKYESDEQTVQVFIYAHGSDGSSIKVLTVAPLRLPPYSAARAPQIGRGAAAAGTWIFHGDESHALGTGWVSTRELRKVTSEPRCCGSSWRHQ